MRYRVIFHCGASRDGWIGQIRRSLNRCLVGGIIVAAAGSMTAGCADRSPSETMVPWRDLTVEIDHAEMHTVTRVVDLGTPASRPLMFGAWSVNQAIRPNSEHPSITWTLGPPAGIRFLVLEAQDTPVRFVCSPISPSLAKPVVIDASVNGRRWTRIELKSGFTEYFRTIPEKFVDAGWNFLTFDFGWELGGFADDSPVLNMVAWDLVEFGDSGPSDGNLPSRTEAGFQLPPYTEVSWALELDAETWLEIAQSDASPSAPGLVVTWKPEQGGGGFRRELSLAGGVGRLRLSPGGIGRGRLALSGRPGESAATPLSSVTLLQTGHRTEAVAEPPVEQRSRSAKRDSSRPPNILVYLVDTLRADHMGCYGYDRPTTPAIDAFASAAVLFENSQAQSPWTRASVASIFTGLWPESHGAQDREELLVEKLVTMAEYLAASGYETLGVTGNGNSHGAWGFAQGFDVFVHLSGRHGREHARSQEIHARALELLDDRKTDQPFFLWVHTIDPHAPYQPPEPFKTTFAPQVSDPDAGSLNHLRTLSQNQPLVTRADIDTMIDLYDGEIAANDASFGELMNELRRRGLYDSTLIVFISDHGEEFFDHGNWAHGKTLYSEMLDTPLIVKPPYRKFGSRVPNLAQHIDLLPTVADYAGVVIPADLPGRSLRSVLDGVSTGTLSGDPEQAVAQMRLDGRVGSSLIEGRWKVVVRNFDGTEAYPRLYDRVRDQHERNDLSATEPMRAIGLADRLRRLGVLGKQEFGRQKIDLGQNPELREQLRALGYVE